MANRTGKKSINRREMVPGFGDRLRGLHEGIPCAAIARKLGYVSGTFGAWENGTRQPGLVELVKICQHFHCSTDYLLGLSPDKSLPTAKAIGSVGPVDSPNSHFNSQCGDCPMSKTVAQQAETIANLSRALLKA